MRSPLHAMTTALVFLSLLLVRPVSLAAQERPLALIRDAEIEHILALYANPVFRAAGLDLGATRVFIVNDDTLNAFVAGGQRVFVFTGLILATQNPRQLVGVLAHETGHIRGGHLSRSQNAISEAQTLSIIAALLGGLAAAASGNGNAAGALILGGQSAGMQMFLSYSRTQESLADRAGVELMEKAGWSPRGLSEFLEILDQQELMLGSRGNPYFSTHPMSFERVDTLEARVAQSPLADKPDPPDLVRAHELMQAKLFGFVREPQQTFGKYPDTDMSAPARYARSVAWMRLARTDAALKEIRSLVAESPANPYFHELEGQILLEGGRVEDSLPPLREAYRLEPDPMIAVTLAQALVALDTPPNDAQALELLNAIIQAEPDNAGAWQQLAVVHGRQGEIGKSMLANGENFFHRGQIDYADEQIERALRLLKPGSPDHFRALDVQNAIRDLRRRAG